MTEAGPARQLTLVQGTGGPSADAPSLPSRVLLVDDHRVFTEAVALAIDAQADLRCVGTPTTIRECLDRLNRTAPDVVLLDVFLPDGNGIDAVAEIHRRRPGTRVVVMTGYTDVALMTRAAASGAAGFLPKEWPISAVLDALRTVRDGGMLVDGPTLAAILGNVQHLRAVPPPRDPGSEGLTRREHEVLVLMGQGLDASTIARQLRISLNTCRGHQKNILAKLDVHSQLEAVVVAARAGLIARVGR